VDQMGFMLTRESEERAGSTGARRALGKSLEEKFEAFHGANPEVYAKLRELAFELKSRGVERYGMAGLFEVLRYESALQTVDAETGEAPEFKLNNSYRSFYARLLMEREPALAGFFELRTQRWQESEV